MLIESLIAGAYDVRIVMAIPSFNDGMYGRQGLNSRPLTWKVNVCSRMTLTVART